MRTQSPPEIKTVADEWEDAVFEQVRTQPKPKARMIFRNFISFSRQRGTMLARQGDSHE